MGALRRGVVGLRRERDGEQGQGSAAAAPPLEPKALYQCPAGRLRPAYGANGLYYTVVPAPM